jgi:serine/threonine protein kinase
MNDKRSNTSRVSRIANTSAIGGILASLTLNESNKENARKTSSNVDKCGKSNEDPSEDNSQFIHGTLECIQTPQDKCKGTGPSRPPHMVQIGMDENQPRPQIMSPLESPIFQNHISKDRKDHHDFNLDQEFESSSSDQSVSISSSEVSSDLIVQNESRQDTNEHDDESNQEEDSLDVDHDSEGDEEYSEHETESEDSKLSDSEASSYIIEEDYVPYGRPISSKPIGENEQDSIEEEDIMEFSSSACTSEGQNENEENLDGSDTETESGSVSDSYIHKSVESGPQLQDAASTGTHLDTLLQDEDDMNANRTKEEEEEESIYSSHLKGSHQEETSYSMQHSFVLSLTASVDKNSSTMKSDVSKLSSNSGRIRSVVKKGQWSLGSRIGQGAFGVVHVGMNKLNGTLMAVKTIVIPSESRQLQEDIRREIELMKSLEHKNIVKYLGCEMDKEKKMLHIFQEWVPGGSVASLLRKFGPFPLSVIRSYLHQILTGLQYLHSKHILHRDIKGGNVLVNDEGVVKLADFGASKCMECLEEDRLENMTMCGTPYFMAPEVFEENYGIKADVWSCACVAYQMCTTNPPWKGLGIKSPVQLFRYITENEGPPPLTIPMPTEESEFKDLILEPTMNCSLANLMEQCFVRDSKQRPSVTQLIDHIFFQETEEFDESILEDQSIMGIGGPLSPISPLKIEEIKRSAKKIHEQWPIWTKKDGLNVNPLALEE